MYHQLKTTELKRHSQWWFSFTRKIPSPIFRNQTVSFHPHICSVRAIYQHVITPLTNRTNHQLRRRDVTTHPGASPLPLDNSKAPSVQGHQDTSLMNEPPYPQLSLSSLEKEPGQILSMGRRHLIGSQEEKKSPFIGCN